MQDFQAACQEIEKALAAAADGAEPDAFMRLSSLLSALEAKARERIQQLTRPEIERVIDTLRLAKPLTEADRRLIKLWLVADADSYTRVGNRVADWRAELQRVITEITRTAGDIEGLERLCALRALAQDAVRMAADLQNFTENQERLRQFAASTSEIDADERKLLIGVLSRKLGSPDF